MLQAARAQVIRNGAVAQLGEHLLCKQGVNGSIPFSSTSSSDHSLYPVGCLVWLERDMRHRPGDRVGKLIKFSKPAGFQALGLRYFDIEIPFVL